MASSTASMTASTTSSAPPGPTSSAPPSGGDSPTSRPLLFFVALGFGVVFTNLWIIVGVKYCFRYNRGRQNQLRDQNGEPIDMNNMPRPRRKREKKLMTMDEVNDRFPLQKYKIWRSSREQNGLSTAGGITAPPSRAASIREHNDLKRVSTEIAGTVDGDSTRDSNDHTERRCDSGLDGAQEARASRDVARKSHDEKTPQAHHEEYHQKDDQQHEAQTPGDAEEDEDPIRSAGVPPEYANAPGDTCAICIDTLEEQDDVRGLSCGHAFHAPCIDPWLTSRRACCPLCKADFYVPKPRNPDAAAAAGEGETPREPEAAHRPRVNLAGQDYLVSFHYRYGFPTLIRNREALSGQSRPQQDGSNTQTAESEQAPQSRIGRLRSHLPSPRMPFRRQQTADVNAYTTTPTTPSQLEAGTR